MVKHSGGPRENKEIIIPGQMYHLDIAFISGLSNLNKMIKKMGKIKRHNHNEQRRIHWIANYH